MRAIQKAAEPASLTQHRAAGGGYDGYPDKKVLAAALVREQRGLCAYCLSRIRAAYGEVRIEHWHSRSAYAGEQLDYSNLLAVCMGNEGEPFRDQHCDTHKGDRELSRNPADPAHRIEEVLWFGADGSLNSRDTSFDLEIDRVLNLNYKRLQNNRKATLTAFTIALGKRGTLSRAQLEKWLREWDGANEGSDLRPYCQVVVYWLKKRLARA
jgi:uncharacterized protein (TIGR02646 family)